MSINTRRPSEESKIPVSDIERSPTAHRAKIVSDEKPSTIQPNNQIPNPQNGQSSKEGVVESQPIPLAGDQEDVPPEGGYGWVVAACLMGINATSWGVNTTYGVYSSYYLENNYFEGGSTMKYAWVGGLSVATCLICGPLANAINRWLGFRITMLIGGGFIALGQCMAGICKTFGEFLFCQGILFGIGLGLTLIPGQPLLAHWFKKRLALASGIATAGSGLGGLILSNTTRVIIDKIDVKWALIINGLISLVVIVPSVLLLKGRHKAIGARQAPFEFKWVVHPGFIWVWSWAALTMMAYFIALYSLASFATNGLYLSQTQGAALQSILAAGQMIGRPLWGYFLDTQGRINLTIICYVICGLSTLVIWLPAKSFGVLIFYALVQGMTGGTIWSVSAPLVARVVGVKDLASALSIYWLILVIPALIGQPIAIALLNYSQTHLHKTGAEAYYISIGFCGGLALAALFLLYGAKRWIQGNWKPFVRT
ncbi:uncharacterized protein L201_003809 [Kwoniella dendrophila CBS 6074]|uniref:Major facilitator superfamily (MFS) profile domain-containing protein n=1 Tax=Kwoniella dendrophila CBS 6074 TaxID=1295534 RepID=A0AAX4JVG1_9TREE